MHGIRKRAAFVPTDKLHRRDFEYERGYDDYPHRYAPPSDDADYAWIYFTGWKQAQKNEDA